ncbi:hypothetical protein RMSM_01923 [Rhodopirellula maiorica SM1]|uniref:Uncharacterized protein n=1 Tax=Rhodopirellula maiorica SM1 TaxID=1265738 RepID=M5RPI8_9BACT|nr:hypothetical protein RMSM_01923 [Rhodopirellula maiorica SM1]
MLTRCPLARTTEGNGEAIAKGSKGWDAMVLLFVFLNQLSRTLANLVPKGCE